MIRLMWEMGNGKKMNSYLEYFKILCLGGKEKVWKMLCQEGK